MNENKLKIAIKELNKAEEYPLTYRIAKYLIEAGYSGLRDQISNIIVEIDPTCSRAMHNTVYNCMRDIELTTSKKSKYHIDNIPNLFNKEPNI